MSDEKKSTMAVVRSERFSRWVRKDRVGTSAIGLTAELQANPRLGDVIPGCSGLRKVRMAEAGRGTRGGFRVVYTVLIDSTLLVLLDGYSKSDKEDLSADELSALLARATLIEVEVRAERAANPPPSEE